MMTTAPAVVLRISPTNRNRNAAVVTTTNISSSSPAAATTTPTTTSPTRASSSSSTSSTSKRHHATMKMMDYTVILFLCVVGGFGLHEMLYYGMREENVATMQNIFPTSSSSSSSSSNNGNDELPTTQTTTMRATSTPNTPTTTTARTATTKPTTKTAYVTMIANDAFVPGVLMLYHSLNTTNSLVMKQRKRKSVSRDDNDEYYYHDFVILEISKLSDNAITKLRSTIPNCIILRHDALERIDREKSDVFIDRYKGDKSWMMFSKLNIFNLVQYRRIVYLDADILVLKDISQLLELENLNNNNNDANATTTTTATTTPTTATASSTTTFSSLSACPEKVGLEPEFNAGFLVVTNPSQELFVDIKSHVNDTTYKCGFRATDQSLLCHYFHPTHAVAALRGKNSRHSYHHDATTNVHNNATASTTTAVHTNEIATTTTSEEGGSTASSSTWLGGAWGSLPRDYMAYYKVIDKRNWHSIYNTYSLLHFNGDKPWLLLKNSTKNSNDTASAAVVQQHNTNPYNAVLYKKNEVLKRWFVIALDECSEKCFFEHYLTKSKIRHFLTLFPPTSKTS